MIDEHDHVALTRDMLENGLTEGDIGTVVYRYEDGERYEVEFVTGDGRTVAVLTLAASDLRPLGNRDILHARRRVSA